MSVAKYLPPFIGALSLLLLVGCGTPMQFIRNSHNATHIRRSPAEIQVYYSEPEAKYDNIGLIIWDHYQPGFRAPFISDVLPKLQVKASQEGGDAIIIRKQEVPPLTERNLRVAADVIRFRNDPEP